MAAKQKSSPKDSTAALGFEAAAMRDSAFLQSVAKPQVVSEAKGNFRKDNGGVDWTDYDIKLMQDIVISSTL
jgi:hypothetical protein